MIDHLSPKDLLKAIVPISRFNKGEANKIFSEVSTAGTKIVVKNNKPTCVLIAPEKYDEMMETIEDYHLFVESKRRMNVAKDDDFISHEQLMKNLNIHDDEIDEADVEIE